MKISYCITCKGRLSHIQQTLLANITAESGDSDVEFVLLNYQSEDGLAEWVEQDFKAEIASGRLVHAYHFPAPFFQMAHAKNLSHRIATGAVICNLDADNFLPTGYAQMIRQKMAGRTDRIVIARGLSSWAEINSRIVRRALKLPRPQAGLFGRIAVHRDLFYKLGGYDERMSGWGLDDTDFMLRARAAGARAMVIPPSMWGDVIQHDTASRTENLSAADRALSTARMGRSFLTELQDWRRELRKVRSPFANEGLRFGEGDVKLNFSDHIIHYGAE